MKGIENAGVGKWCSFEWDSQGRCYWEVTFDKGLRELKKRLTCIWVGSRWVGELFRWRGDKVGSTVFCPRMPKPTHKHQVVVFNFHSRPRDSVISISVTGNSTSHFEELKYFDNVMMAKWWSGLRMVWEKN